MIGIYKKGQGYWTRMMSGIAAGLLIFMGASWLWKVMNFRIGAVETVYVQAGAAVIFIGVLSVLVYYLIAVHKKVVDFLIATEGEMKKVNWSTRREIMGSTGRHRPHVHRGRNHRLPGYDLLDDLPDAQGSRLGLRGAASP